MNLDKKNIIYFLFWFFLFIIFLFFSFNTSRQKLDDNFLNSIVSYSSWFSEFSASGNISKIDENTSFAAKNIVFKDSLLNTVYAQIADKTAINLETNWTKKVFNIGTWIFLMDLNDPSFDYEIKWQGFDIKLLSLWKIFIDNRITSKIQVFPINSTVNLSLMDQKNRFALTNLYLYPHMNFYFDSSRNIYLKNADLYRISAIDTVSYLKTNIYTSDKQINPEFEKDFFVMFDDTKKQFFIDTVSFISSTQESISKNYTSIKDSEIYNFWGISYIQNYFFLLFNSEKKTIYYKNLILEQLKSLFVSDSSNTELISSINQNMLSLDAMSHSDYLELSEIAKGFYMQLYQYDNTEDYNAEINFYKLIALLNNKAVAAKDLETFYYLSAFYSSYDTSNFSKSFYYYLKDYIKTYLFTNMAILTDETGELAFKNTNLGNNLNQVKQLDYFSFMLYNTLISSFDLSDLDRDDLLFVTKQYILLNNLIIRTMWDDKRTLSQVYYNNTLARKILDNFKQIYFTGNRNTENLLELKPDVQLLNFTTDQFNSLASIFWVINKFYSKNFSLLDSNNSTSDRLVDASYREINSTNDEYILAAKDYDSYTLQYDKTKKALLDTKTVWSATWELALNKENFISYMSIFNSVDASNAEVSILENHYEIKNVFVAWINMWFSLYPREANRITNVIFGAQKLTVSYKLDNIRDNYKDLYSNAATNEDREKYDFKNFFINTFVNKQIDTKEYYTNNTSKIVDTDKAIIILKKDKLLWDQGEFKIVSDLLPIKYENINVVKNWDNYDISISGVNMTFPLDEQRGSPQNILVEFASKYIFTNTDHKFTSISIKFLDANAFAMSQEKVYLFSGKSFDLPYNLDINTFADRIKPIIRKFYNSASK